MSLNKVMLIGNLGKDPQVKEFANGRVANFAMATSETYTDKTSGQKVTNTEWHNVVAWGNLADLVEKYTKSGSMIFVEGKIKTESWDDAATGTKRYATKIVADNIRLLGGGNRGGEQPEQTQAPTTPVPKASTPKQTPIADAAPAFNQAPAAEVDDLPF